MLNIGMCQMFGRASRYTLRHLHESERLKFQVNLLLYFMFALDLTQSILF